MCKYLLQRDKYIKFNNRKWKDYFEIGKYEIILKKYRIIKYTYNWKIVKNDEYQLDIENTKYFRTFEWLM